MRQSTLEMQDPQVNQLRDASGARNQRSSSKRTNAAPTCPFSGGLSF